MNSLSFFPSLFLFFFSSFIVTNATANTVTCYELFAKSHVESNVRNLLKNQLFAQALTVAEKIIQVTPSSAKGYGLKAQALLGLKDFEGALKAAEKAHRLRDQTVNNQVLALQLIASAQEGLRRFEDVIITADQILETNPKNKVALEFLSRASAALTGKELSADPQRFFNQGHVRNQGEVRKLISTARALAARRSYKESNSVLMDALKLDPLNPYVMGLLTNNYMKLNRMQEALQAVNLELRMNPKNSVAQGLKIRILLIEQKSLEALSLAEQLDPQDPHKPFYLASALIDLKNYKRALAILNEVPNPSLDILWKKAQAYYNSGDRLQARKALIQVIQNSSSIDNRALATLLRMEAEGAGTTDGLGERILAVLSDSQKLSLMDWIEALEGKHLWEYAPTIPRETPSKSLINDFWLGIHNLPVDGQTFRSTK
jgi:tetratricopeptide (TPR) repeat protein